MRLPKSIAMSIDDGVTGPYQIRFFRVVLSIRGLPS